MPSSMCYFQANSHMLSYHWVFIYANLSIEMNLPPPLSFVAGETTLSLRRIRYLFYIAL